MGKLFVWAAFAGVAIAGEPVWKFDEDRKPHRYEVELEHEERGNDTDRLSLELELLVQAKAVSDGSATWAIKVERVKVKRVIGRNRSSFDSAKPGKAEPAKEVAWFAGLAGKTVEATVTKHGEIEKVSGVLRRVPGPGDFLAEGADRNEFMSRALFAEIVAKLFRLPGREGYSYGIICSMGRAVGGCHLKQKTSIEHESTAKRGDAEFVKRKWKATLHSDGGSIRAGGETLKLVGGEAGVGKGEAEHAPDHLVSFEEKLRYEMPTPKRSIEIERTLEIELAKGR